MAEHLASIFGTEKEIVNCPFYFKIGACRHGDHCSRLHTKPCVCPTLLLPNMFQRPIDLLKMRQHFEGFYEDLFEELNKYEEIENLNICDNIVDQVDNVYVQFREEEQAVKKKPTGRLYAGRPIIVEFSYVTNFHEASCIQYEESSCSRGGYCNFMHLKKISRELRHKLFGRYRTMQRESRSRSRSPYRHHNYEVRSHKSHNRKYNDRDYYHESWSRRHTTTSPGHRRGRNRAISCSDSP